MIFLHIIIWSYKKCIPYNLSCVFIKTIIQKPLINHNYNRYVFFTEAGKKISNLTNDNTNNQKK